MSLYQGKKTNINVYKTPTEHSEKKKYNNREGEWKGKVEGRRMAEVEGRKEEGREGRGYLLAHCTGLTLNPLPSPPFSPSSLLNLPLPSPSITPSLLNLIFYFFYLSLSFFFTPFPYLPLPSSTLYPLLPSPSFSPSLLNLILF